LVPLEASSLDRSESTAVGEHSPLLTGERCLLPFEPGRLAPSQFPAAHPLGDTCLLASLPLADATGGLRGR
jgi:hypothetical protein